MLKFLFAAVVGLALSAIPASAAVVQFRFVSEPSIPGTLYAGASEITQEHWDWYAPYATDRMSIIIRVKVDDVDNINMTADWLEYQEEKYTAGGELVYVKGLVGPYKNERGAVGGWLSIKTNSDGGHYIEGDILSDSLGLDFAFGNTWVWWGTPGIGIVASANGRWEKIPDVPVPASLPPRAWLITANSRPAACRGCCDRRSMRPSAAAWGYAYRC